MNWLKNKLRDWLGVNQLLKSYELLNTSYKELREVHDVLSETHRVLLDKYTELDNGVDVLVNQNEIIESRNRELSRRNEFILKNFQIAVDHNPYENQSWAVVCINGQPQYVNFLTLRNHEAHEIMRYLRHYDKGSMVVDSPHRTMKLDTFKYF
ncbi:hypothetical protein PQE74_gp131 [Bacillus phage vB_BanS_Chewbecca]|uniref:Uncharacterized protein n=1 Tax=Bacillus phage vB_BanS_Chewbecca TaxID=2894786 RepID=A0AAE8YMT1_9CAUD|nr:hypothetical protein PQE74_gp131 [Bacillus phage vB_BanS_Chewbecca]UGO46214.1 hypothetical protein CHEWBECCA_131 [Bacillus phage vB_BanS_Chewbecca]